MDRPLKGLPTEIWLQILGLVARHPTKDEFAAGVGAYDWFQSEGDGLSLEMNQAEESHLLIQRLTLVSVCKTWHPIGIELLWSHVRLILNTQSNSLERILEILREKPYFAQLIKRLTIRVQFAESKSSEEKKERALSNNSRIGTLLRLLPRLNVITYPSAYAVADQVITPSVCIVYTGRTEQLLNPDGILTGPRHFWHNSRILSIELDRVLLADPPDPLLKRLEALHIYLPQCMSSEYATSHWEMPSLRSLSVVTPHSHECVALLLRARETLEYLQLNPSSAYATTAWDRTVEFPRLVCLSISVGRTFSSSRSSLFGILALIRSSRLQFFTLHGIITKNALTPPRTFIKYVDTAVQTYPSLKVLSFQVDNIARGMEALFVGVDIQRWCQQGIEVRIRSEVGDWKTYTHESLTSMQ